MKIFGDFLRNFGEIRSLRRRRLRTSIKQRAEEQSASTRPVGFAAGKKPIFGVSGSSLKTYFYENAMLKLLECATSYTIHSTNHNDSYIWVILEKKGRYFPKTKQTR